MKMISHQAVGVESPFGLGAPFAQGLQETISIGIVAKYWLASVSAVHNVIEGVGTLGAQLAGHGRTLTFCWAGVHKFKFR